MLSWALPHSLQRVPSGTTCTSCATAGRRLEVPGLCHALLCVCARTLLPAGGCPSACVAAASPCTALMYAQDVSWCAAAHCGEASAAHVIPQCWGCGCAFPCPAYRLVYFWVWKNARWLHQML